MIIKQITPNSKIVFYSTHIDRRYNPNQHFFDIVDTLSLFVVF